MAIKRRPAVSPSAYGTECQWRLEKPGSGTREMAFVWPGPHPADSSPALCSPTLRTILPSGHWACWGFPGQPEPQLHPAFPALGRCSRHPRRGSPCLLQYSLPQHCTPSWGLDPMHSHRGQGGNPAVTLGCDPWQTMMNVKVSVLGSVRTARSTAGAFLGVWAGVVEPGEPAGRSHQGKLVAQRAQGEAGHGREAERGHWSPRSTEEQEERVPSTGP